MLICCSQITCSSIISSRAMQPHPAAHPPRVCPCAWRLHLQTLDINRQTMGILSPAVLAAVVAAPSQPPACPNLPHARSVPACQSRSCASAPVHCQVLASPPPHLLPSHAVAVAWPRACRAGTERLKAQAPLRMRQVAASKGHTARHLSARTHTSPQAKPSSPYARACCCCATRTAPATGRSTSGSCRQT
jgi:hypothetical protein